MVFTLQGYSTNTIIVYQHECFTFMASLSQCSVAYVRVSDLQARNSRQLHQKCDQKKPSYTFPSRQSQQQLQVPTGHKNSPSEQH